MTAGANRPAVVVRIAPPAHGGGVGAPADGPVCTCGHPPDPVHPDDGTGRPGACVDVVDVEDPDDIGRWPPPSVPCACTRYEEADEAGAT